MLGGHTFSELGECEAMEGRGKEGAEGGRRDQEKNLIRWRCGCDCRYADQRVVIEIEGQHFFLPDSKRSPRRHELITEFHTTRQHYAFFVQWCSFRSTMTGHILFVQYKYTLILLWEIFSVRYVEKALGQQREPAGNCM